jgi:hypothetical protein
MCLNDRIWARLPKSILTYVRVMCNFSQNTFFDGQPGADGFARRPARERKSSAPIWKR